MIASVVAPSLTTANTISRNGILSINSVLTPRSESTAARREPLKAINMATPRVRVASSSSAKGGGKTRRTSARLSEKEDENNEGVDEVGRGMNGYRHTSAGKAVKEERPKKRKADYDERVDDFVFSRAEPKKQKPSATSSVTFSEQPIMEEPEPRQPQKQTGQKRKTRAKAAENALSSEPSTRSRRAASKEISAEQTTADDSEVPRRTRRKVDHTDPAPSKTKKKKHKVDETKDPDGARNVEMNGDHTPQQEKGGHTTIALPFADTPVISKNKEMRMGKGKGQRRSSLGMRGRRASSLIDSGASNALPHDKVSTADFYKHIGSDGLPEPRRMRQLLTWCATRAIGEKPSGSRSEDESARLAARVIQEELLKDFSDRSELWNWFDREEKAPPKVVVKKPNPKNIQNAEKIKELEAQIHRLQEERQALSALLRQPPIPPVTKPLAPPQEQQQEGERYPASQRRKPQPQPIDPALLDPSQLPFLNILTPTTPAATASPHPRSRGEERQKQTPRHREPPPTSQEQDSSDPSSSSTSQHHPSQISSRLSRIASSIPTTIDAFASGIHDVELYRDAADRVAGRVLGICARRLEERDRAVGGDLEDGDSRQSPDEEMDMEESGETDRKGKGRAKDRDRDRSGDEDIGLVLGALSRVERR